MIDRPNEVHAEKRYILLLRDGAREVHASAVFELLERVQQHKVPLLEAVHGDVVALVNNGYEAPMTLDHHL